MLKPPDFEFVRMIILILFKCYNRLARAMLLMWLYIKNWEKVCDVAKDAAIPEPSLEAKATRIGKHALSATMSKAIG